MESVSEQATEAVAIVASAASVATASATTVRPVTRRQDLPAKGACWYCDHPLDCVRRFCGKDCASAYDEEAGLSR